MTKPEETQQLTPEELDALMEGSMDDIENLPDYVTPPNGFYKLHVKKADPAKVQKDKRCIAVTFEVLETIQLNNPAEHKVKEGSLFSQQFFPDTSVERPHMWRWVKKTFRPFFESIGAPSIKAGIIALEGQVVTAVVTLRPNEDKTQYYPQVDKVTPA